MLTFPYFKELSSDQQHKSTIKKGWLPKNGTGFEKTWNELQQYMGRMTIVKQKTACGCIKNS
jgi:hypothetical protein